MNFSQYNGPHTKNFGKHITDPVPWISNLCASIYLCKYKTLQTSCFLKHSEVAFSYEKIENLKTFEKIENEISPCDRSALRGGPGPTRGPRDRGSCPLDISEL